MQREAEDQVTYLTTQHHLQSEYTCPPLLSIIAPCLCADVEKDEQISKLRAAVRARSSECDHLTAQLDEYGHHMGGGGGEGTPIIWGGGGGGGDTHHMGGGGGG